VRPVVRAPTPHHQDVSDGRRDLRLFEGGQPA
jgi:hypothetical protein